MTLIDNSSGLVPHRTLNLARPLSSTNTLLSAYSSIFLLQSRLKALEGPLANTLQFTEFTHDPLPEHFNSLHTIRRKTSHFIAGGVLFKVQNDEIYP